jgi:Toprim domain
LSTYAAAALERECADLARTTAGRNNRLNRAAFAIGQFVGVGEIGRGDAERNLFAAAAACGYVAKDGAAAARSAIKSGLDCGARKPRKVRRDTRRATPCPPAQDDEPPPTEDNEIKRERAKAQWFWLQRQPIAGTIAQTYLREARGYRGVIPPTLGFLPARGDHPPALIAAFGIAPEPKPGELAIAADAVMAVQLITLLPDGSGKADCDTQKITIGKGALGSPIIVAPPNDLLGIAITEGLEDALSIHEATGLGAWASGGAARLPALAGAVPDYINCITVFGDDDDAGRRYASDLVARLRERGFEAIPKILRAELSS